MIIIWVHFYPGVKWAGWTPASLATCCWPVLPCFATAKARDLLCVTFFADAILLLVSSAPGGGLQLVTQGRMYCCTPVHCITNALQCQNAHIALQRSKLQFIDCTLLHFIAHWRCLSPYKAVQCNVIHCADGACPISRGSLDRGHGIAMRLTMGLQYTHWKISSQDLH